MKNFNKYFTVVVLLITAISCKEDLEKITPQQSIAESAAFADESGANGALIGVYGLSQDLDVLGSMPQIISEFQSDNVNFIGSFPTLNEIRNYVTISSNGTIGGIWIDNYETILAANAVIANVPEVPGDGFTTEERNQLVGEAKFMRALIYFNMVNLFSQPYTVGGGTSPGIPLYTEPFTGEIELLGRGTVDEVHALIASDLNDAISLLPGDALGNSRATVGAAHALLARLHLYRGEWQDAADEAAFITGNPGTYTPANNLSFFSQATSEELFTLINTAVDNGATGAGGWDSYYEPSEQGGRGDCPFSADLLSAFDPSDLRLALSEVGDNGNTYTQKFDDAVNNSSNVPVIRVSEMYLTRAEALAEQGQAVTAEIVGLLNMTRTRAGLTAYTVADFANVDELIDAILDERRFELAFEGHRRMDLLRTGNALRPATSTLASASAAGAPKTILPIPQGEIDLNPNLNPQNPSY